MTQAHVEKIKFHEHQAKEINFLLKGQRSLAAVKKEIILASGAVGSPQILQTSGIGPGELLSDLDIKPVRELPGVGENLQDHLQMRLVFKVKNTRTLNLRANSLIGRIGMGMDYFLFKRGPMTMAPSQLGGFAKSDPSIESANLQYHIQPLSTEKLGDPLHPFEAITACLLYTSPSPRDGIQCRMPSSG